MDGWMMMIIMMGRGDVMIYAIYIYIRKNRGEREREI